MDQALGVRGQADEQGPRGVIDFCRQEDARNEGNVGRLDTAIGEIDACWRLGRPRDTDDHHVGLVEVLHQLAVVVAKDELHGVDAAKVSGVHDVLAAGPVLGLATQIVPHRHNNRVEEADVRDLKILAFLFQRRYIVVVDQGVKDQSRLRLNAGDNFRYLLGGPHHGPNMFFNIKIGELNKTGAGHGADCFARRIRHQMDVVRLHNHDGFLHRWTSWGQPTDRPKPLFFPGTF